MLGLTILSIFILIIINIIVLEVRNERKYQESRRKKREKPEKKQEQTFPPDPVPSPQVKTEEPTPEQKPIKKEKKLPHCTYPQFSHQRLIEMGLSDEESKEFVQELIPQLEAQIPLIKEVLSIPDFHQMERLTHSIKGSATNLGTGGISDLLVGCNTYLKTGTDFDIANAYFGCLKHYTQELKEQYA